jgi:phage terminase small subunit
MNERQRQFIDHYLADPERNATKAYERVYAARGNIATINASRLLNTASVREIIDKYRVEQSERVKLSVDDVIAHVRELVEADPRELSEYRRGACRYCYGGEFMYQRTANEEREAYAAHLASRSKLPFDQLGGTGYTPKRDPHPDCPECYGDGTGYEYFKDSRTLSPSAARLYAGVKVGKSGIEIMTRSQDGAVKMLGEHLGAFVKRHELTGKNGGAIKTESLNANVAIPVDDPIAASRIYQDLMKGE